MVEVYLTLGVMLILTIHVMDSQEDLVVEANSEDILVELLLPDKEVMEGLNLLVVLVRLMLDLVAEEKLLLVKVQLAAEEMAALVQQI
jgi:hypothetical protein